MGTIENCPICGGKMKKGYLYGRSDFQWSIKKKRSTDGMETITHGASFFRAAHTEAYRCYNCKMVLFFYGEDKPREEKERVNSSTKER